MWGHIWIQPKNEAPSSPYKGIYTTSSHRNIVQRILISSDKGLFWQHCWHSERRVEGFNSTFTKLQKPLKEGREVQVLATIALICSHRTQMLTSSCCFRNLQLCWFTWNGSQHWKGINMVFTPLLRASLVHWYAGLLPWRDPTAFRKLLGCIAVLTEAKVEMRLFIRSSCEFDGTTLKNSADILLLLLAGMPMNK